MLPPEYEYNGGGRGPSIIRRKKKEQIKGKRKKKVNKQGRVKAHIPQSGFQAWDLWKLM